MNIIIIEDEPLAQAKLEAMLLAMDSSMTVKAKLGSVKESIQWLHDNPAPDLAFVDIQLSDDHSFEIFRKHPITFPVVFTTAYDKYLLESFEFNSIDYLLKPITEEKLKRSLDKIKDLKKHFIQGAILELLAEGPTRQKKRILGKKGAEFTALELNEAAYFYTEHGIVFVRDFSGTRLTVDHTLGELENMLAKTDFFRLNRKFIAHRKAIDRFRSDNGKIRIILRPELKEEIHVSKEGAPDFRKWVEGNG